MRALPTWPRQVAAFVLAALASLAGCEKAGLLGVVGSSSGAAPVVDAGQPEDAQVDGGIRVFCEGSEPYAPGADDLTALRYGEPQAPAPRVVYPYSGTVFPAQLPPPTLMWTGASASAVLLRLSIPGAERLYCLDAPLPDQLELPQAVWDEIAALSGPAAAPVTLDLSVLVTGQRTRTETLSVRVAPAPLPGAVYYMQYAPLSSGPTIQRVRAGQAAEPGLTPTNCDGCHGASTDGSTMLAFSAGQGRAFARRNDDTLPTMIAQGLVGAEFGALSPDGSTYISPAHISGTGPRSLSLRSMSAALFDTETGRERTGHGIPGGATTPAFSPEGQFLAFNDYAIDGSHGLAVMDYDQTTASASEYRELMRDASGFPGWPTFLPDASAVVFALHESPDFSGGGAGFPARPELGGDLHMVALTNGATTRLHQAVGFATAEDADPDTYLPFGAEDLHRNYFPHVAPVAAGGFAWVVFDSLRNYGVRGRRRQLWVAALSLGMDESDPSHPPFWLPGQDPTLTNIRGIFALEPCPDGSANCLSDTP